MATTSGLPSGRSSARPARKIIPIVDGFEPGSAEEQGYWTQVVRALVRAEAQARLRAKARWWLMGLLQTGD